MRLIDADEVVKAIDHHTSDTADGLCLDEDITIILEELPSVSIEQLKWERDTAIQQLRELGYELGQEPKKGKWEDRSFTGLHRYRCDQCGGLSYFADNFCPNCGADMRVGGDAT